MAYGRTPKGWAKNRRQNGRTVPDAILVLALACWVQYGQAERLEKRMTAREVLDELESWGRQIESGAGIGRVTPRELHNYWMAQVADLRQQIEAEESAWDAQAPTVPSGANVALTPAARAAIAERLRAELNAEPDDTADWTDAEPSALEVALRLVESGKVAAVPRQAAAFACDLIDCIRARQSKGAGK